MRGHSLWRIEVEAFLGTYDDTATKRAIIEQVLKIVVLILFCVISDSWGLHLYLFCLCLVSCSLLLLNE